MPTLRPYILALITIALVPLATHAEPLDASRQWGQWRGPLATGVAPHADPPIQWSETENVRWKVPLPGLGHSTPVVWGNRIFVTAAIPFGEKFEARPETAPGAHNNLLVTQRHRFVVISLDRATGKILWQTKVYETVPHEGGHTSGSLASASPITDGKRVYAFFGSHGLYALDYSGKLLWKKTLGKMQSKHAHGEGATPVLYQQTLAINWDHEGQSFVVAFDSATGKQKWRVERDEVTSWASPIVVVHRGQPQLIVAGSKALRAYDLSNGKVIWSCGGLSHNVVATPVAADGMVFAASSYEKQALLAIRLKDAKGDITGSKNVVWSRIRTTPYVPSPLLYGEWLYFLRHYQNVLTRANTKTGDEPVGPFRLDGLGNIYASPVGAKGRIYITDLRGGTLVLDHKKPKPLAFNQLDDSFSASAAIVDKELFLRGAEFLYCISKSAAGH